MYRHGWYQIAFETELTREVSPAAVGSRRLVVLRTAAGIRVADALCPHRGADLAHGGRFEQGALVCPFHGFRIGLDTASDADFCVREYSCLVVGGLVFVRLSQDRDNGFAALMTGYRRQATVVPGFTLTLRTDAETVIENAFDQAHFRPVHGIRVSDPFCDLPSERGEFGVRGSFELPPSQWQRGRTGPDCSPVAFTAQAFSPGIVVSQLGGAYPYTVVTAATPLPNGECTVRLSLLLTPDGNDRPPRPDLVEFLLHRSRAGLERDSLIWEHRGEAGPARYTAADAPVRMFREFCAGFAEEAVA